MNKAEENLEHLMSTIKNLHEKLSDIDSINLDIDKINRLSSELKDYCQAHKQQKRILSDEIKDKVKDYIYQSTKKLVFKEYRSHIVCYRGGNNIKIYAPYYTKKNGAGKKNSGESPSLKMVNIYPYASNDLATHIAKLAAAMSSYEEVKSMLKDEGINMSLETISRVAKAVKIFSKSENLLSGILMKHNSNENLVIAIDGGRVRTKVIKRGPKTKAKRNRYKGAWREVKIFVIYTVDDKGKKVRNEIPVMDGMIGGPEDIFHSLMQVLTTMNVDSFKNIIFMGDGAKWIWNGYEQISKDSLLSSVEQYQILDYYHASEHLSLISRKISRSKTKAKSWVKKMKSILFDKGEKDFIKVLEADCKGSKSKDVKREIEYFKKNRKRIDYKLFESKGLPIGSGAIESAVRRVVNLRLKGNSIFWKVDNANDIISLRSLYKSGRWSRLEKIASNDRQLRAA